MKVGKTTCLVCGAKFGNASIKCHRCGTLTPRGMGKSKRQQGRKPAAGPQLAKQKPALPPLGSFLFDDSSSHGSPESPQWELSASSGQAAAGFQLMGDMPLGVSLSQSNLLVQTVARNTTAPLVAVSEPMGNAAPLVERRGRVDESPLYQHGSGVLPSLSPVPFLSTAEERALFEELGLDDFLFVSAHLGDGSISVVLRYEANEMGVDVVKYINQRCQGIEFWSEVSECELPPAISLWWAPNSTKVFPSALLTKVEFVTHWRLWTLFRFVFGRLKGLETGKTYGFWRCVFIASRSSQRTQGNECPHRCKIRSMSKPSRRSPFIWLAGTANSRRFLVCKTMKMNNLSRNRFTQMQPDSS